MKPVAREELTVEVVRRYRSRDDVKSTINVLHMGVPQYALGPYDRELSLPEALQLIAVEERLKGETK